MRIPGTGGEEDWRGKKEERGKEEEEQQRLPHQQAEHSEICQELPTSHMQGKKMNKIWQLWQKLLKKGKSDTYQALTKG